LRQQDHSATFIPGMRTPTCSNCGKTIPPDDVNVARDVAFCRACNLAYPLSSLASGLALDAKVDLHQPPPGCWHRRTGMGSLAGASHRSLGMALPLLGVALFWNGIVSVFVLLAVSSTLHLLNVPMPEWFPAPRMNDEAMGTGMTIFLWIFLTPFIVIGLGMIGGFLSGRQDGSERGSWCGPHRHGHWSGPLEPEVSSLGLEGDPDGGNQAQRQ
jgi:hypothetical protein